MRQPSRKKGADWFRIENKKNDDGEPVAKVYIYDEIGFWGTSASEFVQMLAAITEDKIELHLNTPGGEIFDGIAIYNALKGHHAEVDVYIDALAASAGSFIAQAGDNVFIARNANMMIHDGLALVYGNAQDMYDTGALLDKLSNNIADIYFQRASDTSAEEWRALMQEEVWYSAQEAVDAGLADEMIEIEAEPKAENFSLLKVFNHKSRNSAPSPEEVRLRVFNRVKEARMSQQTGTPRAEGQQPEGQTPEGANPEGQNPEGQQPEEETEGTQTPETPAAPATPATPPVQPPVGNSAAGSTTVVSFTVNGQPVTDPKAVQTYINSLEQAQREAKVQNRKEFITSLASGTNPKITATQMTATEAFALSLTDEQYDLWVASWDAAPPQSLLGDHAADGSHGPDATPEARAADDELEIAKGIVKQHKISNMSVEKIKATASYQKLVAADPAFDLSKL